MAVQLVATAASQLINTSTGITIPVSDPANIALSPFSFSVWINANWGSTAAVRGRRSFVGIYGPTVRTAGLAAGYYNNKTLTEPYATARADANINMNLTSGAPPGTAITSDVFSIRWTGYFNPPTTGTYYFQTTSDDGIRVTINGIQVISNWADHSVATDTSTVTTVTLTAGTEVSLLCEYYNQGGPGVATLSYRVGTTGSFVLIPQSALSTSAPLTNTFTALQIGTSTGSGEISAWTYGGTVMVGTATNFNAAALNTWINVAYVFDGLQHNLYVNGALAATAITEQQPGNLKYITINGYYNGGTAETDNHYVDTCILFNRALSSDEVLTIYNAVGSRHGIENGQVAYYEFDEGIEGAAVSTVLDLTGSGIPLLMTGTGTAPKYTYNNSIPDSNIRPPVNT